MEKLNDIGTCLQQTFSFRLSPGILYGLPKVHKVGVPFKYADLDLLNKKQLKRDLGHDIEPEQKILLLCL